MPLLHGLVWGRGLSNGGSENALNSLLQTRHARRAEGTNKPGCASRPNAWLAPAFVLRCQERGCSRGTAQETTKNHTNVHISSNNAPARKGRHLSALLAENLLRFCEERYRILSSHQPTVMRTKEARQNKPPRTLK